SVFETQMINFAAKKGLLFKEIRKNLGTDHQMALVKDGRGAALATLKTMSDVAGILAPRRLIDKYEETFSSNTSHVQGLWETFTSKTGKIMALGARTLAMIWDSAWAVGQGNTDHGHIEPDALRSHYHDANLYVPSPSIKLKPRLPILRRSELPPQALPQAGTALVRWPLRLE